MPVDGESYFLLGDDITASSSDANTAGSAVAVGQYSKVNGAWIYEPMRGIATVAVQVTGGAMNATLAFECSIDGSTWVAINGTPFGGGTSVSSTTAVGKWLFMVGGKPFFRVRCSSYTATCHVKIEGTSALSLAATSDGVFSSGGLSIGTAAASVVQSNTVLVPLGASSWTLAETSPNVDKNRYFTLHNDEAVGGIAVYVNIIAKGGTISGSVSSTSALYTIQGQETLRFYVLGGYMPVTVAGSSKSTTLTAYEELAA